MRVVLRKWTPRYKYKNFLTHFRLSLFPGNKLARQEIITPPETANQQGQRDLLASMTIDQDFPEKVTHCRHFFFYF